jgi:hypothetical protein
MGSTAMIEELRASLDVMQRTSVRAADFEGALFDVVFDILTADTYVAGVATKILDGESIPHNERVVVVRSPLIVEASVLVEWMPAIPGAHSTPAI